MKYISEIFYLLNFFSNSQIEQWELVPDNFPPVWVETNGIQCNVNNSIYFLCCVFVGCIYDTYALPIVFNETTNEILFYEIKTLLDFYMTQFYAHIFIKKTESELGDIDRIWLVLSRLCKIALSYEEWDKYEIKELTFQYFVDKYTYPYDSSVGLILPSIDDWYVLIKNAKLDRPIAF